MKKQKSDEAEQRHQEERLKVEVDKTAETNADDTKEGPAEEVKDDHGIKEPDKEPAKVKREAAPDPYPHIVTHLDDEPVLERETSGLAHLRRRRPINR